MDQVLSGAALTQSWVGTAVVALFVAAYVLAASEEFTHIRKSKPMILSAGLIWVLLALWSRQNGADPQNIEIALEDSRANFAALMLFLLVATRLHSFPSLV